MIKRTGFTLAEVLVTLLIIGVVAALTIPTLLGATNDNQLKTAYKKAFSSLSNAMDLIKANETKCNISTNADLAKCFQTSMKGTIKDDDIIVTSDGMAYKFYYRGAANKTSLADACALSDSPGPTDSYNFYFDTAFNCVVVVDVNGLTKDTDAFANANASFSPGAMLGETGKDQQAILIESDQIYPLSPNYNGDVPNNKGYEWLGITENSN